MQEHAHDLLVRLARDNGIAFDAALLPGDREFATPDGLTLHGLDWRGRGDPVLLLHGGALTAHTWDLVALDLSREWHCVALDLRGHGLSDWSDDYTIDASVRDLHAIVEQLGWKRFHIVGMSLGGNIAAHYAASPGSRAASLSMVDVAPNVDFQSTAGMREFIGRPISGLTLDALVDAAVQASSTGGGRDKIFYRYLHMTHVLGDGRLAWRHDRRRPHDYPHMLGKLQQIWDLAGAIACPALVVRGGRSRVLTDEKVASFAARFGDGSWNLVPEAGHNVQEDSPKRLADMLRVFFARSAPRP